MHSRLFPLTLGIAGAVAATLLGTSPFAAATVVRINFSGQGMSGYANLTLAADHNASANYQPQLNTLAPGGTPSLSKWDPDGAEYITGASGSISYTPASGVGVTTSITGVQATNPGSVPPVFVNLPTPGETTYENLPASFSWLDLARDADSYDNLFYFSSAPLVCPPNPSQPGYPHNAYPFSGGALDIFGAMFTLGDGSFVDLWSAGKMPAPLGLNYGFTVYGPKGDHGFPVMVTQPNGVMASIAVPEPAAFGIFGLGLLLIGGCVTLRRREPIPT